MEIMYEVRQKISNHPVLKDLERDVVVYRTADNMDVKQIPIRGHVEYFDGEENVTSDFKSTIDNWIVGNHYEVEIRDENNEVVLDEETQELIKMPAFDYIMGVFDSMNAISYDVLKAYILENDNDGKWDLIAA